MPVYLGEYEGCASNREEKFARAMQSVFNSSYKNVELVINIDGNEDDYKKTMDVIKSVKLPIEEGFSRTSEWNSIKEPLFSGKLRTRSILLSSGDIIVYLDSDDMFGVKHIEMIVSQMESEKLDWCYFNDFIRTEQGLKIREVELEHGLSGTSSIAHVRNNCPTWEGCNGYGHDWMFIEKLMKWSDNYDKIYGTSYMVCHIPEMTDF